MSPEPSETAPIEIADDRDHSLDPRSVPSGRLGAFVGVLILGTITLPIMIGVIFVSSLPSRWQYGIVVAWGVFMVLLTLRAWIWPALRYRYTAFRVGPRGLVIRRGVLWRSVATVPRSRIQHTDVSQGPLQRPFGLSTLTVHTAGTQFAAVPLSGLAKEVAEAIRDNLIGSVEDDGV